MILEVAILDVRPGETENFERDFRKAQAFVAQTVGYQKHELRRCVEDANRYLLNIWWDTLEAHTEGFRCSPQYEPVAGTSAPLLRPLPGRGAL
jgi:heme-degrading monooxygenase HmoA